MSVRIPVFMIATMHDFLPVCMPVYGSGVLHHTCNWKLRSHYRVKRLHKPFARRKNDCPTFQNRRVGQANRIVGGNHTVLRTAKTAAATIALEWQLPSV